MRQKLFEKGEENQQKLPKFTYCTFGKLPKVQ